MSIEPPNVVPEVWAKVVVIAVKKKAKIASIDFVKVVFIMFLKFKVVFNLFGTIVVM